METFVAKLAKRNKPDLGVLGRSGPGVPDLLPVRHGINLLNDSGIAMTVFRAQAQADQADAKG